MDDLNSALYPGASYFVESQYVSPDDAAAGNQNNNASWRPAVFSFNGSDYSLSVTGSTQREEPAIFAWQDADPSVQLMAVGVPGDGRFWVGFKATDLGNGTTSYEYAIHNLNSDRAAGSVSIDMPDTAIVTQIGFHDVAYHSGEPYDGTDWTGSHAAGAVTWATTDHATNPDANALRWGTLYNFRFVSDTAPGDLTIGLFKPGTPSSVTVTFATPMPPVSDFSAIPVTGDAPLTVAFTDLSTGDVSSWSWDFGDGGTSSAQGPQHVYTTPGVYDVTLLVSGGSGASQLTRPAYITVSTPPPPSAPTGLVAAAVSSSEIELQWTDTSINEDGFEIERSLDGSSWSLVASVAANVTTYTDGGLSPQTTYMYRVIAFHGYGESAPSGPAGAMTFAIAPVDILAAAEVSVRGTVTGSFVNTHADDDVAQEITERLSGGKPSNRYSFLEHEWTFNIPASASLTLFLSAYRSPSSDGDDFVFEWSTDGVDYQPAVTVVATADTDSYQTLSIPTSVSGTLRIRVRDTDRTPGNQALDSIHVDHMFIRSVALAADSPPSAPTDLAVTGVTGSTVSLTWMDGSTNEDAFEVERSLDGGTSWALAAVVGANSTSHVDTGLPGSTAIQYRVRARNQFGNSAWSASVTATTLSATAADHVMTSEIAIDGSVTGSFLDTQAADGSTESIREAVTNGPPSGRISFLEHKWVTTVPVSSGLSFHLVAHRPASPDGDDFVFAWSTDNATYHDMLTISNDTADGIERTFNFPPGVSGTVYIRVIDTDRTMGNRDRDRIIVDHMFLRTQ